MVSRSYTPYTSTSTTAPWTSWIVSGLLIAFMVTDAVPKIFRASFSVEWLMGLPAGHVTDPAIGITRNEQLKALGNGVVPQQAAAATRAFLTDHAQIGAVA